MSSDAPGTLTVEQFDKLVELGLLGKVELIESRVLVNMRWELVFGPDAQRAAAEQGIRVRGVLDALLEDPQLLAELDELRGSAGAEQPPLRRTEAP